MKEASFTITKQGGPILNSGWVVADGEDVAAIEVDMKSKWCQVDIYGEENGSPMVMIGSDDRSLHLTPGLTDVPTSVSFPDYKGWRIFVAEVVRYTFRIVFIRYEQSDNQ